MEFKEYNGFIMEGQQKNFSQPFDFDSFISALTKDKSIQMVDDYGWGKRTFGAIDRKGK